MNWEDTAPVLTGNPELDHLTGGWQPYDLILVGTDDNELLEEFFSKQIQGISHTTTNIGVITTNMPKLGYDDGCLQRERIIECGEEILKLNVVESQNCEISCLSKADISLWSCKMLIRKMVRDFDIGIVFIEDINMITIPPELKSLTCEAASQPFRIRFAKYLSADSNIPIVVGLDNLSGIENKDYKSGFCDCNVIGVLTNEYNTETAKYSHVLELVKHRSGLCGKVNF